MLEYLKSIFIRPKPIDEQVGGVARVDIMEQVDLIKHEEVQEVLPSGAVITTTTTEEIVEIKRDGEWMALQDVFDSYNDPDESPVVIPPPKIHLTHRFEVYEDKADHWRWRCRSVHNGQVVASSGEAYASKQKALRAARRLMSMFKEGSATLVVK